jgi:hypothetical protein
MRMTVLEEKVVVGQITAAPAILVIVEPFAPKSTCPVTVVTLRVFLELTPFMFIRQHVPGQRALSPLAGFLKKAGGMHTRF